LAINEKGQKRPLYSIFTSVPGRYDLINRIFTWGLDERWRRKAARACLESKPARELDLCCGTGDLAIWLARLSDPSTSVYALDYSLPMLTKAIDKEKKARTKQKIAFVHGDVASLPFPDNFFDSAGIAFAFRNLTYKNPLTKKYLREIVRVIRPGGQFVIVESSQPPNRVLRRLYHYYLRWFVFPLGQWISGNKAAYKYLSESAKHFYRSEELGDILIRAGFEKVTVKRLLLGVCAIHVAVK